MATSVEPANSSHGWGGETIQWMPSLRGLVMLGVRLRRLRLLLPLGGADRGVPALRGREVGPYFTLPYARAAVEREQGRRGLPDLLPGVAHCYEGRLWERGDDPRRTARGRLHASPPARR